MFQYWEVFHLCKVKFLSSSGGKNQQLWDKITIIAEGKPLINGLKNKYLKVKPFYDLVFVQENAILFTSMFVVPGDQNTSDFPHFRSRRGSQWLSGDPGTKRFREGYTRGRICPWDFWDGSYILSLLTVLCPFRHMYTIHSHPERIEY